MISLIAHMDRCAPGKCLFRSRHAHVEGPALTGALFDVDDDRVFKLTLEKRGVSSLKNEGVDVTITWS